MRLSASQNGAAIYSANRPDLFVKGHGYAQRLFRGLYLADFAHPDRFAENDERHVQVLLRQIETSKIQKIPRWDLFIFNKYFSNLFF